MKIARNEHFGYTIFDTKTLKHKFGFRDTENNGLDIGIVARHDDLPTRTDVIKAPIRIYYEITNKCHLRCKHCLNDSGQPMPDEMSIEQILRMVDRAHQDRIFDIRVSGGEPVLKEGWHEIFTHIHTSGMFSSLNTSGVYPGKKHDDIIQKFAESHIAQVTISVEGNKEHHDNIRGNGTFDQMLRSVKDLYAAKVNLRFNTVLMQDNIDDIPFILELASRYCTETSFFYMRPTGRALSIQDKVIDTENYDKINAKISSMKDLYPNLRVLFNEQVFENNSIHPNRYGLMTGFPDGFTRISVVSNGDVYPNCYLRHVNMDMKLGNVKDTNYSISPIWLDNPKMEAFRKMSHDSYERCSLCDYHKSGNCKGEAIEMTIQKHALNIRNPYCGMDTDNGK